MTTFTKSNNGACPRCMGGKMGVDFDGDTICINCGFVLYARAPDPTPPNRAITYSDSRFYRRRAR